MSNNMLNFDDQQTDTLKIYRILSIDRLAQLIINRKNGLVSPVKWEDPFENFFLKSDLMMKNGDTASLEPIRNNWYGQCWTINADSDAMWRIYSKDKAGVRISTTVEKLFSSFYDESNLHSRLKYFIGKVKYLARKEIEEYLEETTFAKLAHGGSSVGLANTLLIKRLEFQHENEVRLLFYDVHENDENKLGKNGVAQFDFPWEKIITEVALDPRLDQASFEEQKQKLVNIGCTIPISQSELYKFTPTVIRLE